MNKLRNVIGAMKLGFKIDSSDIADGGIELDNLAAGIAPSHVVKFAGTHAYGGGGTSSAATVTGVLATDVVVAILQTATNAVSVTRAAPTANTVTFTFSADPGAATVVNYVVLRAAA